MYAANPDTGCLGGGCEIGSSVVTEPATMAPTQPLGDRVRGKYCGPSGAAAASQGARTTYGHERHRSADAHREQVPRIGSLPLIPCSEHWWLADGLRPTEAIVGVGPSVGGKVRHFRFGVVYSEANGLHWADQARRVESEGFSTLLICDHYVAPMACGPLIMAAASATTRAQGRQLCLQQRFPPPCAAGQRSGHHRCALRRPYGAGHGSRMGSIRV